MPEKQKLNDFNFKMDKTRHHSRITTMTKALNNPKSSRTLESNHSLPMKVGRSNLSIGGRETMNNKKQLSMIVLMLLGIVALSAFAAAVPISNVVVKVDNHEVDDVTTGANRLDLVRGEDFELKVSFDATADAENVEVQAFISGYEYNDVSPISDETGVFDVEENVTYIKRLTLSLPDDADEDDYRLRVLFSDRNSAPVIMEYRLKLDVERSEMRIDDVVFNPESEVKAGRSLLTLVRVENSGQRDQQGVKITAAIPELHVSASDYIDEVESGDEVTSEALYFRLPACADAGVYDVQVTMTYDSGRRTERKTAPITVTEDERCGSSTTPTQSEKTVIGVGPSNLDVAAGSTANFPVTLTNAGTTTKTYSLSVEGTNGWATTKMTPSNVVVLGAGETQAVYVAVTANQDAAAGDHTFVVTVKHNNEVLQQLPATLKVAGATKTETPAPAVGWEKVKRGLEIGLVVLVVLLVVLGLIIAFNKMKNDEEEEDNKSTETGQTYY